MDLWLQEKYILLLSNRLDRFSKKGPNLFNCRCYFCGDSQKNKTKARAYIYKQKENYAYHCHNCGKGTRFEYLLKEIDPALYYDMKKEAFGSDPREAVAFEEKLKKVDTHDAFKGLEKISDLPAVHQARQYLALRKIPASATSLLYYCRDFRQYTNAFIPGKLESTRHAVPRIIIPFLNKNNQFFGYQGRALDPNDDIRYISIILDDSQSKAFNINNCDFNKRYYVFEGPFDSMFLDNSIAVCGSDVLSVLNSIGCNKENGVIVFDNEPRNKDIVNNIGKAIKYGWKVCVWPSYWEHKDVNDAILDGMTASEVNAIIDDNTYSGPTAELKHSLWRKNETV